MNLNDIKFFLDEKAEQYNHPNFIENDPIQIPHQFSLKQDIEIAGFLTATISWGNRKSIIASANRMLNFMDQTPYDFVINCSEKELSFLKGKSIHRTFNGDDLSQFLRNLNRIYKEYESLEALFLLQNAETNFYHALHRFRSQFLGNIEHRSHKHISSTYKNASAKRLMMFLRWMVRKDNRNVDFGLWQNIAPKYLSIPLDIHTGNISRKLGLIQRKQNDWKSVEELDNVIRTFDSEDPAKYDFALFGLGISGEF